MRLARLLKDANDIMEKLESKMEETAELAAPLTSDNVDGLASVMVLANIVEIPQQHASVTKVARKDSFLELSGRQIKRKKTSSSPM
jgi:hypothetical protein